MEAIASEAGVARSHLYYHVKSKDERGAHTLTPPTASV